MNELKNKAEALGIKVDARWSEATLAEKIKAAEGASPKAATEPETLFPVRLLKNYQPKGEYQVIEAGQPPRPGLDFKGKVWANSIVALPRDEALGLIEHKVVTVQRVTNDDGKYRTRDDGTYVTRTVETRFPLAERADAFPA